MKRILLLLLAFAAVLVAARAQAQTAFPARPITMIVPFAAGGPTDVTARIVATHMSRKLGQPVVIENVLGDAGQRAVLRAMQAAPDGYTIIMGHMGTHGAAPAFYPDLKYDPINDFAPVGQAAGTPIVIVTNKRIPAHDLQSFVRYVREKGPALKMAHAGLGSVSHSTAALLNSVLKLNPTMVSYNGTGPALNDLIQGKVDLMTDQIVNVAPKIEAGMINALAIATPGALAGSARRSHHLAGRISAIRGERLERCIRARGHAEGHCRQAQCRIGGGARGREYAQEAARSRRRHSRQGRAYPGGAA